MVKRKRQSASSPQKIKCEEINKETEVISARCRLKGVLLDALENDESNSSNEYPSKRNDSGRETDVDEKSLEIPKRSYVLKLFDRNVDLWQFTDSTPLYPICRAWILNNPKMKYKQEEREISNLTRGIPLPGPEGEVVSRIPPLLPVQESRNKDNILMDNDDAALPTHEQLLQSHLLRWNAVRELWQEQSVLYESRYKKTQHVLNTIKVD